MRKSRASISKPFRTIISLVIGVVLGYVLALILSQSSNYIQLIGLAFSALIGIGIPIWREYFVTKSKLSIEISSIGRKIADSVQVSLGEYPELASLNNQDRRETPGGIVFQIPIFPNQSSLAAGKSKSKEGWVTIEQLDGLLEKVEQEFKGLPQRIEEKEKEYEKVNALDEENFSEIDARRLNTPIYPEVSFSPGSFSTPEGRREVLEGFKEKYKEDYEKLNTRYLDLQSGSGSIPAIKGKIEQIKKELTNNRSYFTISVSLVNSGRLNTSIKAPAVLRVYIGRGNYVDLRLTLKDFETKSEVSANSTKVAVFDSPEISHLPEDDRKLINTYWGQSVACVLFIENVHGSIYNSNAIAFAEGLYQKIIYDRLASAAANYDPYASQTI